MDAADHASSSADWLLPYDFDGSANPFRDRFGTLSIDEWCETLVASITEPIIAGLEFPRFPPYDLQNRTHGSSGEIALREASKFYKLIASRPFFAERAVSGGTFLDFGTGWGRIARFFLRHFDLDRYCGFEPQRSSCFLTRALNPYLMVFTGQAMPDRQLPSDRFDLVVGWSVFSHLSEVATAAWLEELARIMRPDGYCVMSTFGDVFLDQLVGYQAARDAGQEIHWYHRYVLETAGDIVEQRQRYASGELVWIPDRPGAHYGTATFLPERALRDMIENREMPFDLVEFDRDSVNMDVFILRRR